MTGFEPATSASRTHETRVLSGDQSEVTSSANEVSAMVSPRTPKTGHGAVAESASKPGEQEPESRLDNADFSAAVIAIMALPLTDDEKAEALRRLLASEQ